MIIKCPQCGGMSETDMDVPVGQKVQCPYCNHKFAKESKCPVNDRAATSKKNVSELTPSERIVKRVVYLFYGSVFIDGLSCIISGCNGIGILLWLVAWEILLSRLSRGAKWAWISVHIFAVVRTGIVLGWFELLSGVDLIGYVLWTGGVVLLHVPKIASAFSAKKFSSKFWWIACVIFWPLLIFSVIFSVIIGLEPLKMNWAFAVIIIGGLFKLLDSFLCKIEAVPSGAVASVELLRRAAEQGDARAQYKLGECYLKGKGVDKSVADAAHWFRASAEHGNDDAQTILVDLITGDDLLQGVLTSDEIMYMLRSFAEKGNLKAQCALGERYCAGNGVEVDVREAVRWWSMAAERGFAEAQLRIGDCYGNGCGVGIDKAEAIEWYRKAAEQGLAEAQYTLGLRYYSGDGVGQNFAEAVHWWRKAAEEHGFAEAKYQLGNCYFRGQGVDMDKQLAVKWYLKAAKQGYPGAQTKLADCYFYGEGVRLDSTAAVRWYRMAAQQGDDYAINALERLDDYDPNKR